MSWDAASISAMERADAYAHQSTGGGGLDFQSVLKQMQQAQAQANQANEQRYSQILGLYDTVGQAGRTRIGQQTAQAQAKGTQDLTSRGLGNTTITSAVSRGIANDAEQQTQQLNEGLAMQKAGVMERRSDTGPDLGMYANLLQASAAGQGSGQRRVITTMAPGFTSAFGSGW